MKKFGIVFNHDEHEYSVYSEVEIELNAWNAIEFYQKEGRKVELSIRNAADKDAAIREAEAMNEIYQYHKVEDTLRRYLPKEG
jgi:hypothetical protein